MRAEPRCAASVSSRRGKGWYAGGAASRSPRRPEVIAISDRASTRPGWRTLRDPVHFLAFGFGSGLVPRAPGTAGSLVALLPAWLIFALPLWGRIAVVAAVIGAGIWVCGESARRLGRHDHQSIVLDEIAGILLTALAVPAPTWFWLALAFVLFRVFDIWKPWPIRDLDHSVAGGVGIMLDDLMAAVYAAVCLTTVRVLLPTV